MLIEVATDAAKGITEAQRIINKTLSVNYLQHEAIKAQELIANSANHTNGLTGPLQQEQISTLPPVSLENQELIM